MNFLYYFDLFGTFIFAISGALLGVKKRMDLYGSFVLALSVAVGGGTIRDMMLGLRPFVLNDGNYLLVTVIAVIVVVLFSRHVSARMSYINIADAIGLGVFTVIGATKGINAGLSWYGIIFLATLTGTGGGMIRDILARDIPVVLRKEIYASACIVGTLVLIAMHNAGLSQNTIAVVTSISVTVVRLFTLKQNINLPVAHYEEEEG